MQRSELGTNRLLKRKEMFSPYEVFYIRFFVDQVQQSDCFGCMISLVSASIRTLPRKLDSINQ